MDKTTTENSFRKFYSEGEQRDGLYLELGKESKGGFCLFQFKVLG